jgi:flagellar basal body-associated protein FliL
MNGIKALKISVLVVIVVALIYTIVNVFMYGDKQTSANYKKFGQSVVRDQKTSTEGTDPSDLAVDGILINLRGSQYSYMKADMTIKMKNKSDKKKLEKNIEKVRDLILRYSSTKSGNVLATPKGKEEYKNALKEMISDTFGYDIDAIYFRNFVLAQ